MVATLDATVENLDAFLGKLRVVTRPAEEVPRQVADVAFEEARTRAKPHAADRGDIARTVRLELAPAGVALQAAVRVTHPLARVVEEGRPAGKRGPSIKAIKRWAEAHGIQTPPRELREIIRARGTEGVRFMEEAAKRADAEIPRLLGAAAAEIGRSWER